MKNIHTDNTFTEHGFVSVAPYGEGFIASWLDGRNTVPSSDGHGKGAMTLRSAEIDKEGEIINQRLVDNMVCIGHQMYHSSGQKIFVSNWKINEIALKVHRAYDC